MVLCTRAMEWQAVQESPAWASGVPRISCTGRSMRPENSGAGSWQPAHQREAGMPAMDCMYSMDLRYHWLLKDEKWCALSFHCFRMSGWQRPQASESRKNLASMWPPGSVRDEDGKRGLWGPPPSPSMLTG